MSPVRPPFAPAATLALAAALGPAPTSGQTADPRPAIVELVYGERLRPALELTELALASEPERFRELGLGLLRGDLLERLGREREAVEAYALALSGSGGLEPWARLRLAALQERMGHPEVAAGLVATLLSGDPPEALVTPALELLHRALEAGGDCRLLGGVRRERLRGEARRHRDLAQAECWLREGRTDDGARLFRSLLEEDVEDALAWEAAARLAELPLAREPASARLIGLAAFHHREFAGALRHLAVGAAPVSRWFDSGAREVGYATARSYFWLGRHEEAARRFEALAENALAPSGRADALYQLARCRELVGRGAEALESYLLAYDADPNGEFAGAALLAALRIEVLQGDDEAGRTLLGRLAARPAFGTATARAAIFFAVHDLERGRPARVASALDLADRTGEAGDEEIAYWRGRLAEAQGNAAAAVERYLEVLATRPYHPLASAARRRLDAPALLAERRRRARELVGESDPRALHAATILGGPADAEAQRARLRGVEILAGRRDSSVWVRWRETPVGEWPIWRGERRRPEELLVALGLFADAPGTVARQFPASDVRLAFTGASSLSRAPGGARRGIALSETLFERRPREVPLDWTSPELARLLYPFPWAPLIRAQAAAHGVDPALLAGILREESRFDPRAVSPAAARGLAQLTLPTAQRLARQLRWNRQLGPEHLHDPGVSVPLAAAYLAELSGQFPDSLPAVLAAYNAGEAQAALWRRFCLTGEPEEYLAKIGFRETKAYVVRVLESRDAYRALYPASGP